MNFLNIDFHISVIADIAKLLGELGHTVDSHSLSGHTWVMGRGPASVPGLVGMSHTAFGQVDCDRFRILSGTMLMGYDGFIVTHSPCLAGLYEHTGKPVVCVVSTRYNMFCNTAESREWLDALLKRMHTSGQLTLLANNAYDAWHVERHIGIKPQVIPSICDYTGATWSTAKTPAFIHGRHDMCGLRRLVHGHSWDDVADAAACVCIPYNASLMSMFERHSMGMPIVVPSKQWLRSNPHTLSELSNVGSPSAEELEMAAELSDWYVGELPGITTFDSEEHLIELLKQPIPSVTGMRERKTRIIELWRGVIGRVKQFENQLKHAELAGFWQWADTHIGQLCPDGQLFQRDKSGTHVHAGRWEPTINGLYMELTGHWRKRVELRADGVGTWYINGVASGTFRRIDGKS